MRRLGLFLAGLVAGLALAHGVASATTNSSGTYSLPSSVNPVISGTQITHTWANTTLSDVGTELTDRLTRSGKGGMNEQLRGDTIQCSVAKPTFSFVGDADTGIYRAGANNPCMSAGGTSAQCWSSTTSTFPLGVTITNSQSNGWGGASTGNGTGYGWVATGGGTNGTGVLGTGGATNGVGVRGTGAGTGVGGHFSSGTAATGGTRQGAVLLDNGDLRFTGTANVTSTTAVSNALTPSNLVKAWALLSTGSATPTVLGGFNIASASCAANVVDVTMASAMASTSYATIGTFSSSGLSGAIVSAGPSSTTVFKVYLTGNDGSAINLCTTAHLISIMVLGDQ